MAWSLRHLAESGINLARQHLSFFQNLTVVVSRRLVPLRLRARS